MTRRRTISLWLAASLAASTTAAQNVEYYHLDAIGNVRGVSNQAGQFLEQHDYLPYGEECLTPPCAAFPSTTTRRFTGKERDPETGIDYFGARYYTPRAGRFTTVDPSTTIQENILDPQRWNRYTYGRNNPLRFVDPDGRDWLYRAVMGQAYVQQYGDRSSFSVITQGITADIARAWPQFQEQMAVDMVTTGLVMGLAGSRGAPGTGLPRVAGGSQGADAATGTGRAMTGFIDDVTIVQHGRAVGRGTVDVRATVEAIESGNLAPRAIFENRPVPGKTTPELPVKPSGYYQEFVHPTPGVRGAGPQRIVRGQGGELYYTPNHYRTFIPLN